MILTDGVHLVGTDLEELHDFAEKIGLQRRWFQNHPMHPHYDLTSQKKAQQAIEAGAKPTASRTLLKELRRAGKLQFQKVRRPMTEDEKIIARALAGCRFLPGSFDKRFCHDIFTQTTLTERQAEFIAKMAYRYRGQIGDAWVRLQSAVTTNKE